MTNEIVEAKTNQLAKADGQLKALIKGPLFEEALTGMFINKADMRLFLQSSINSLTRVPKLAQCTKPSFFGCLMQLAQFKLNPDGRNAHLIPFENRKRGIVECQLIIDYKGLITLAYRCPNVSKVEAFAVYRNDSFRVVNGEVECIVEDPFGDRGELVGFYAMCQFKDGVKKFEIMSKKEVDSVRARSRAANAGPWVTDYTEMGKKTVFKRLSKWLPVTPELQAAIEQDDREYDNGNTTLQEERKRRVVAADLLKGTKEAVEEPIDVDAQAESYESETEEQSK